MQLITYCKKHYRSLLLCASSMLAVGNFAEGAPTFYSKIEKGTVTAKYKHDKAFSFSMEKNDKIIKSILEKLPLAQSATIVASGKPVKYSEFKDEFSGYTQRNIRQLHMVAVSFARSDLLPMMYFQVKEDWRDCEPEGESCSEVLSLEITGPSKHVRDLNDFGAFPTSLNVVNAKISLENSLGFVVAGSSPATVNWSLAFSDSQNGVDDYLRYFRGKAGKDERKITMQNVRGAMALWALGVSKSAFTNL